MPAVQVRIQSEWDVAQARQEGRGLAEGLGFSAADVALISTAISEVAQNMLTHAQGGELRVHPVEQSGRRGLEVVAEDEGPGIADVPRSLQDGYSTAGGLGLGLSGARRMMDDFELHTAPGAGTRVTLRRWVRGPGGGD